MEGGAAAGGYQQGRLGRRGCAAEEMLGSAWGEELQQVASSRAG
jgi:hypothetical protein